MMKHLFVIAICLCTLQMSYSQEEDGVVSFVLPVRNSLTFNRYAINPTFSFVREQNKYISFYNKREWVQFDDAPLTYLASYSGRIGENMGAGIGVFQQNYGVLTTFGGVLNFAYNVQLNRDSNLTFGLNVGAYKSGINTANVVTNTDDPSFQKVPENLLLTINPGVNYGLAFLDFGVSISNLAVYNFNTSNIIANNPEQGIQAHLLYTGYMTNNGFFDDTKFSGLIKSEFRSDVTIISGNAMLTVPKGIWAQVGYNSLYGVSGGLGLNITPQIAIEYNFEKAVGELIDFGPSHDITLAYRFKNRENYDYSSGDEVGGLLSSNKRKPKAKIAKAKIKTTSEVAEEKNTVTEAKLEEAQQLEKQAEIDAKLLKEQKAQVEIADQATLLAEQKAEAKALEQQKAKEQADAQAKLLAEQQAKAEADTQAKLLAEQQAKAEADAQAKLLAEQQAKAEADAQAKLLAEQQAKAEADAQAKLLAEQQAKAEADAQAKLLAEQQAKDEADAQAKLLAEQQAKDEADAQAKLLAEQQAKDEADAQAKLLAEQQAKDEADAQAKLLAEQQAKDEADAQAKLLAEQQAKDEADAQAKLLAEQQAKAEADAQAKLLAEQQAKVDLISNPKDELSKSMYALTQKTEASKTTQSNLLKQFDVIVATKSNDLKDLKEENDLSEQGISVEVKPFKSITEENNALNAIKSDLDETIKIRNEEIKKLTELYEDKYEADTLTNDDVFLYYKKTLDRLKAEQKEAIQKRAKLETILKEVTVATEFERRRRIKRATYDNEAERYSQDRAVLKSIKENTVLNSGSLTSKDFDFGEEQSGNIQIMKNVQNVDEGYYLILAVHNDVKKRNEFVTKVVASGSNNVDFFYDVNTSKYYIYYDRFDNVGEADNALNSKEDQPYNAKMSLIKIEN